MIHRRRQTITLYTRWIDVETNTIHLIRRVFPNASWDESGNVIAKKTGSLVREDVFVNIFWTPKLQYIPIHEWLAKKDIMGLHGLWSVDMATSTAGRGASIVVDHEVDFEFEPIVSTPTIPAVTLATQAENAFIQSNPGSYRITRVDNNDIGSTRVRHMSLRVNRG